MTDSQLLEIAGDLGVRLADVEPLAGSMSGSHVHAVNRLDGRRAVLKVTTGADGPELEAGRRELHVYRHLRERVGVRTPELIDHREAEDFVALLLTAHPAPLPAIRWSRTQWLSLADDLAQLHQTPVPAGSEWRRPSWLADTLHRPDLAATQEFWSCPGEPELLAPILSETAALWEAIEVPAECFLHGDCHTDNILINDNELVWTDWQGAGAGNPGVELAFPSIRATPAGALLPQGEMIRRYATTRGLGEADLSRAVLAAELSIFLFVWPEYARYNNEFGIDRVHQRVQYLARRWLLP